MLNFDFLESSSHAVFYELREARVPEVELSILPLELDLVVFWNLDRQTSGHIRESTTAHISCYLVLDKRRQAFSRKFSNIYQCLCS